MKTLLTLICCAALAPAAMAQVDSVQLLKDVETLSADKFMGRQTGSRGNRMAQFYLLDRFKKAGIQPWAGTYEQPFYFTSGDKRIMGTNLFGYIPGKTDSVIVISAHYDHVGVGPGNGTDSIFNGADDNASGVAAILGIAAWFAKHPPRHTLIFAAFDGEEMGLRGARDFVSRPPVPLKKIKANINLDMVSRNGKNELYACGTFQNPHLKPAITAAAANSKIKLLTGHDRPDEGSQNWTNQSDQGAFHAQQVPFIYFGVEDHEDYHKVSDEFSRIQPSFFYQAANTVLDVLKWIDQQ
ncbi:M20/M25/M40 family metallo-hydrolase [Chitinophaga sp. NPDC101104]|uniref:M20/M25/M40 family metallo-hydrolase n=1 Tax=Chitinophaga sp. NPDC101104 TaxID=3390561 RepID=UPI003D011FCA